jgi:hypothetical protein
MGWAKIDHSFFRHPKVIGVSKDAKCLYIAALCYCGENMTDGVIPVVALRLLGAEIDIKNPAKTARELVDAGLWIAWNDAAFQVNDYLSYNESSDERKAKQEAARERMQRMRSQNVRANKTRTSQNVREQEEETEKETEKNLPKPFLPEGVREAIDSASGESASAFHDDVERNLARTGWACSRELTVGDRGDGRPGRIDLVAEKDGLALGFEFDRVSPRAKSAVKLRQFEGIRVIVVRDGDEDIPVPDGIDFILAPRSNPTADDERFTRFWAAYPRKVAKEDARKRWDKLKPSEETLATMLETLKWQRQSSDWLKDGGQFIPYPASWLNDGRWQDEPTNITPIREVPGEEAWRLRTAQF